MPRHSARGKASLVEIEADTNDAVLSMRQHHLDELDRSTSTKLTVDRWNEVGCDSKVGLCVRHSLQDTCEHGRVRHVHLEMGFRAEEELHITCAAVLAPLETLIGHSLEISVVADRMAYGSIHDEEIGEAVVLVQLFRIIVFGKWDLVLRGELSERRDVNRALEVNV